MNPNKPEYFRPALIAGALAGVLAGLPFGNCLCCLWILGGAAVAAKLLAAATPTLLKAGDGALVGALTGIVAAVVDAIVAIPFRSFNMELARRMLAKMSEMGGQTPAGLDELFNSSGAVSPGSFILGLFFTAVVFTLAGTLGGIIGVSLFAKKAVPPPAAPTGPADAPPPAPGPPDAA